MIRVATEKDKIPLVKLGIEFLLDSNFNRGKYTPSIDLAFQTADAVLDSDNGNTAIAVEVDGQIAGFGVFSLERYWTVEFTAHCFLFYISPRFRNGKVAAELLDAVLESAKAQGAVGFYASATGGFDDGGINARAFALLLKRKGFMMIGNFLYKEF